MAGSGGWAEGNRPVGRPAGFAAVVAGIAPAARLPRVKGSSDQADADPARRTDRQASGRPLRRCRLAGFAPDEIAITAEQNVLTVKGRKAEKAQPCLVPGEPDAWTRCTCAIAVR